MSFVVLVALIVLLVFAFQWLLHFFTVLFETISLCVRGHPPSARIEPEQLKAQVQAIIDEYLGIKTVPKPQPDVPILRIELDRLARAIMHSLNFVPPQLITATPAPTPPEPEPETNSVAAPPQETA